MFDDTWCNFILHNTAVVQKLLLTLGAMKQHLENRTGGLRERYSTLKLIFDLFIFLGMFFCCSCTAVHLLLCFQHQYSCYFFKVYMSFFFLFYFRASQVKWLGFGSPTVSCLVHVCVCVCVSITELSLEAPSPLLYRPLFDSKVYLKWTCFISKLRQIWQCTSLGPSVN